jgi:putative transposase
MSHTAFYQLYYHLVWSTKGHLPQIKATLLEYTAHVVTEDAKKRRATVVACAAMRDHVHFLVSLPPTIAVSTFIGQVKGATAHEINSTIGEKMIIWQEGYGALTLRAADLKKVARYVNNQPSIHASRTKHSVLEVTDSPVHGA